MKVHKVLWTGGWDSTFRVLDLVLNKNKTVQPHYGVGTRKNTNIEIKTMDKIKQMIFEIDPTAKERILDTVYFTISDIPSDEKIDQYRRKLASTHPLGLQYSWLARYTESQQIDDLELCIHVDDTVESFIKDDVQKIEEDNDVYYTLVENPSRVELSIFSNYHFPLYELTKLDMEKIAIKEGFKHIMEETWFCHTPIRNKPCGMCPPCRYTKEEGLGRRVPKPTIPMKIQRKIETKWNGVKRKLGIIK